MFKYTTAIKKLRKLSKRKKVVQGGSSAGKTFSILPILADKAIKNAGIEISVVSETIPHLRRGAMKDFLKVMEMTGRFFPDNWNKSLLTYKFDNGSYIEFFSADQESKLRGARRNILYINEANNVSFNAYHQMAIRTSSEIWLDFNPVNEFWAHTEVLKEPDSEHIILTYEDNEALPENVISDFNNAIEKAKDSEHWKNWVNVYVYGLIGRMQGVVFDNWSQVPSIPDDAKLLGYGLDFGYTNDPTAVVGVYKMNDSYYFDEVLYSKGLTNQDIAKLLINKCRGTRIYADSAEPKSIEELRRQGLNVIGAEKGKDSIMYGINLMQQKKMYVTKDSLNIIKELRNYTWATDKEGEDLNKPIDAYNHSIDAIRYMLISMNKFNGNYGI